MKKISSKYNPINKSQRIINLKINVMIKQLIGENAGKIWQILNDGTDIPLKKLQKLSGMTAEEFNIAIGWLARENKIHFFDDEGILQICLIK